MADNKAKAWEKFNRGEAKGNYVQWPNEAMLKLVFGRYLEDRIQLTKGMKVLDVGCGFGNNLLPFLVKGYDCYGTEVTKAMAAQTQSILHERGFKADIRFGTNRSLPFKDAYFDLLLSINVIHYEAEAPFIEEALKEYRRVLKKDGRLILFTVGTEHIIINKAKKTAPHRYQIRNFDFRDGTCFFCFETEKYLKQQLGKFFKSVETGRVREDLMTSPLDFLVAVAKK